MSRLRVATVATALIGLALMIPFEAPLARALGVASLFAFIACGVCLIAVDLASCGDDVDEDGLSI